MNKSLKQKIISFFILLLCLLPLRFSFAEPKKSDGLWDDFRPHYSAIPKTNKEKVSRLLSLSYLQGYNLAPKEQNVTIYNKDLAFNGLNLYISGHAPEAILMDMQGKILHKWHYDINRVWPMIHPKAEDGSWWSYIHLLNNGDLLALYGKYGLIKIDKDSHLLWAYRDHCHHGLTVDDQNNIYVLTTKARKITDDDWIQDNLITVLTPDGKKIKDISIYDLFKKFPNTYFMHQIHRIAKMKEEPTHLETLDVDIPQGDVFHTNSLKMFDGKLSSKSPLFNKGNVLVSLRSLGVVAIIDLKKEEIVWLLGPKIWKAGQHNSILLDNGDMLLFENFYKKTQSRVIEFEPLTQKIVWQYIGDKEHSFFSSAYGTNQRLANGNTLITESTNGHAFEVTPAGKIVWEFYNPFRTGENNKLIAVVIKMMRLDPDFPIDWLKNR